MYDFNLDLISVYNCVKIILKNYMKILLLLINNYNSCPELKEIETS